MSRRGDLLSRGYLPENLPPIFVSVSFGEFADSEKLVSTWVTRQEDRTRYAPYNATKRGHQRRLFGIPNPIAALDTALFIDRYWGDISEYLKKSPFSISTPHFDANSDRAVSFTPHSQIPSIKSRRLARARYIVRTDISRFFPSIYTHALPWSFHGKAASKRDHRLESLGVFFNRLDFSIRQGQDGQTIGLPIGPDVSRIVAEVVATAVDLKFKSSYKGRDPRMIRHVDDVWIGAQSSDEADSFLYVYREALRDFELDINELKTSVVSASDDIADFWPIEVKTLLKTYFRTVKGDDEEKVAVLDRILGLARSRRDDGVIKFALRRFDKQRSWNEHWDTLGSFLEKTIVNFPHCIEYVASILAWRSRVQEDVGIEDIDDLLSDFLAYHARLANDEEVAWALWLAKEIGARIKSRIPDLIATRCGPIPLVGLFDCVEHKVFEHKPNATLVLERVEADALKGPLWMFAYEAVRNSWVRGLKGKLSGIPEVLQAMLRNDVRFYDPTALPRSLEGRPEGEWITAQAIGDIGGMYGDDEDDEDDDEDDNEEDGNEEEADFEDF